MRKPLGAIGFVLGLLLVGPVAAHAQTTPCYPPPCASAQITDVEPISTSESDVGTIGGGQQRSSAPFVAAGLLMVSVSFGIIGTSRRMALARCRSAEGVVHPQISSRGVGARSIAELSDVH